MSSDDLARFPAFLPQTSPLGTPRYQRVMSLFAVLGPLPEAVQSQLVHSFSSGQIHVCCGTPPRAFPLPPSAILTAVYRLEGSGPDAAPTGRLFVRFAEGVSAQSRAADLAALGLQIDAVPAYAPHTAWLRSESGDPASALVSIAALTRLGDVVRVEPEVLAERRTR